MSEKPPKKPGAERSAGKVIAIEPYLPVNRRRGVGVKIVSEAEARTRDQELARLQALEAEVTELKDDLGLLESVLADDFMLRRHASEVEAKKASIKTDWTIRRFWEISRLVKTAKEVVGEDVKTPRIEFHPLSDEERQEIVEAINDVKIYARRVLLERDKLEAALFPDDRARDVYPCPTSRSRQRI